MSARNSEFRRNGQLICEDSRHFGHDETTDALATRLEKHIYSAALKNFTNKVEQLGSYGGGNHFGGM